MEACAMILTKRYTLIFAVNALLILINVHVWWRSSISHQSTPGGATVEQLSRQQADGSAVTIDLAPERIRGRRPSGSENTTRIAVWTGVKHVQNKVVVAGVNAKRTGEKHGASFRINKPETEAYVTSRASRPLDGGGVDRAASSSASSLPDDSYKVPDIQTTELVNCARLLANDRSELAKAQEVLRSRPKVPIYEETYMDWFKDCARYRQGRGYVETPLTGEEEAMPLAFSVSMYTDVESTERLIRAIYRPHNLYCIHVDTKSSLLIHRTMRAFAACFDNVWIASRLDKVKWGDVSVLLPDINCMRDFVRHYRAHRWRYMINLTGQEFPLRTNYELARIAAIFNGSNDIGGSLSRMDRERVDHIWTHRWSKTYQQTIFYDTMMPKKPPLYNLTYFKGEIHGLFSRRMVEYVVESPVAQYYLDWCWDSGHPSEHYYNTLNYNPHLKAPGGYEGPLDVADEYSENEITRVKNWLGLYGNRTCHGKVVRGICVYGVEDAPWLATRPELFANKFHLTYHYLGYDCLEELHRNRTKLKDKIIDFNEELYRNVPTVKYSRKDGLPR